MMRVLRNRRTAYLLPIAAAIAAGILLRARGLDRSLWQDEAWVANSVLADSLAGMFHYDAWLQTSPPLFLLLARAAVSLFGLSNWALRAVPFVSGSLACALTAALAWRLFRPRIALLMTALAAFSPAAVEYSAVLKQYSGEALAATAMLLAAAFYAERRTPRRYVLLVLAALPAMALAYGVALLLPGLLFCLSPWFLRWWLREKTPVGAAEAARWLVFGVVVLVTGAAQYWLFVLPNSTPLLSGYWKIPADAGALEYAVRAYSGLFVMLGHLPLPRGMLEFTGARVTAVVCGLIFSAGRWRRPPRSGGVERSRMELLALVSGAAILTITVTNLLNLYPLVIRTTLVMLPCVLVALGFFVDLMEDALPRRRAKPRTAGLAVLWAGLLGLVWLGLDIRWNPVPNEQVEEAVRYLKQHASGADRIYVHATCAEGFKLYRRMLDWPEAPAVYGTLGWPCCPRRDDLGAVAEPGQLWRDLDRALPSGGEGRLWVLNADRRHQWELLGQDQGRLMAELLASAGCREAANQPFLNLRVRAYACPAPGSTAR